MVLLLVLATVLLLGAVEWLRSRRRARTSEEQTLFAESETLRADATLLHPGMAWVRPPAHGAATVGAAPFAVHFAGDLERIELPRLGERLRAGEAAVTLVSSTGRRLPIVTPLAGQVVAVQPHPLADPAGWMLRIRPRDGAAATDGLLQGASARRWIEEAQVLVQSRLVPALGPLAQDGGVWRRSWGDLLDDHAWMEVRNQLFPDDAAWRRRR
jgi:glycine cleavage system H lipoate-binding protein